MFRKYIGRSAILFYQIIIVEIVRENFFQTVQNVVVRYLSCDELTMIKSLRIVEHYFNLRNDDLLTELVNVRVIFLLNVLNDVVNGCFFFSERNKASFTE